MAKTTYMSTVALLERLHRQFLMMVEDHLDHLRVEDVNGVQALLVYHIANDELSVGELITRGYYHGSNVSYNVRKLVENGYLVQQRSPSDQRSVRVKLTDKGMMLYDRLDDWIEKQAGEANAHGVGANLSAVNQSMKSLGVFWTGLQSGVLTR